MDGLKIEFCWILAPKLVPKMRNRSLHFPQFLPLGTLLAPRPPKTSLRGISVSIWGDLGLQLRGFWMDLAAKDNRFLIGFVDWLVDWLVYLMVGWLAG